MRKPQISGDWYIAISGGIVLLVMLGTVWIVSREYGLGSTKTFDGIMGIDAQVSPDGRSLVVIGNRTTPQCQSTGGQVIQLYDLERRIRIHESLTHTYLNCAWSADGESLAVSQPSYCGVDIRDREMNLRQTIRRPRASVVGNLSFDKNDVLYAVMVGLDHDRFEVPQYRDVIWTNPLGNDAPQAEPVSTTACPHGDVLTFNVSAVPLNDGLRVAISYAERCPVKVLRITRDASGERTEELEYEFPEVVRAWVRLSPDGRHLALFDTQRMVFTLNRLQGADVAEVVRIADERPTADRPWMGLEMAVRAVDISRDGRLVACRFNDRVRVLRIPDGKEVFNVRQKCFCVALAPDGRFLVTCPTGKSQICLFDIPDDAQAAAPSN